MPDPTDRLNLDRFDAGENWKEDGTVAGQGNPDGHNDTVSLFDELAVDRGPISERPTSGDYDDEMYYAVDQRTLWRWDAGANDWEPAAGLGTESDPIPGTTHHEAVSTKQITAESVERVTTEKTDSGTGEADETISIDSEVNQIDVEATQTASGDDPTASMNVVLRDSDGNILFEDDDEESITGEGTATASVDVSTDANEWDDDPDELEIDGEIIGSDLDGDWEYDAETYYPLDVHGTNLFGESATINGPIESESHSTGEASPNISTPSVTHIAYQHEGNTKIRQKNGVVIESEAFAGDAIRQFIENQSDSPFHLKLLDGDYTVDWPDVTIHNDHQWITGTGEGVTTVELTDDAEAISGEHGVIEIVDGVQNSGYGYLTVDGNQSGTGLVETNLETVEHDGDHCTLIQITAKDGIDDNFDFDDAEHNDLIRCTSIGARNDGIHMSTAANFNKIVDCVSRDNGVGFTQQNGARGNQYIRPLAYDNSIDYDITDEDGGGGAALYGVQGPLSSSNFEGVSDGVSFPFALRDDFGGHDSERWRTNVGLYHDYDDLSESPLIAGYRPRYYTFEDAAFEDDQLRLGTDGEVVGISVTDWLIGEHEFAFEFDNTPSSGAYQHKFLRFSGSSSWYVFVHSDGRFNLRKEDAGDTSDVISSTWPVDADSHTAKVTRTADGEWELILDGTSQGTETDTFIDEFVSLEWTQYSDQDVLLKYVDYR